ncbi:MAG: glycoside hydrolase family 3 protein [Myxococcales bacterium]|nr:glycoside hydrolase family 3 protein [Myxococcales bacterium]
MIFFLLWLLLGAPPQASLEQDLDRVARVEELIDSLDLSQQVGQLLIVGFGGTEMGPEIEKMLRALHPGGVLLFDRNVRNNRQLCALIRGVREAMADEVQPFVAIDQEGGNVVRVREKVLVVPGAMSLGATRDPVLAYLAGQGSAIDLGLIGIDMNLAPVLDINRAAENPVINVRAFGDRAENVSRLGLPFLLGQQHGGAITVAKHFPGHGTTRSDSHFDLPRIELSLEELRTVELAPFRLAFASQLDAVMLAHVEVPALDPDGLPASLSPRVIDGLLRREMGFEGLAVTDDLEMRAITDRGGVGAAAVQAIRAGADQVMVLWTQRKKEEAFQALLAAVQDGTLPRERLRQALRRILSLKLRRGTLEALSRPACTGLSSLPNPFHQRLAMAAAARGLTLVRNEGLLPLCPERKVVAAAPYPAFLTALQKRLPHSRTLTLTRNPSAAQRQRELEALLQLAGDSEVVVIGVANAYQARLAQEFYQKSQRPLLVVSFGSPYWLKSFPRVAGYLCTYSYQLEAQQAAAEAIAGERSLTGRLPVTLSENYPNGFGLMLQAGGCRKKAAAP